LGALLLIALALSVLPVATLRWFDPPGSALMFWRRLTANIEGRAYQPTHCRVRLTQLPKELPLAVIAAEDQRFLRHRGFDWIELGRALDAPPGTRLRGASTLTQQLARNLFLWPGRSWLRKGLEAYYTVLLETLLPKRRILELYLDLVEFGPGVYGVCAAARVHFGVDARDLSRRQAALLAAVLPNPHRRSAARPSAGVVRRAEWIEQQMQQLGGPSHLAPLYPRRDR
jgi:monofunctional biosynthetic peptidoglycan transglycosylase